MADGDLAAAMELSKGTVEPFSPAKWADHVQTPTPETRFARGLIAESGGEVIGVAVGTGLTLNLEGLSVSAQTIMRRMVLLDFLAVRADRRGEGWGRRLAEAFLDRYRAEGHRAALANIAPARDDLVSLYRHWGWHVGAPAAGLGIQIGTDAVLINEKPVRTAWLPLVPEVRPSLTLVPGALVVTGIFD
ncbi:GNAT family N-acetyltransferase [Streptomyces yangpuensis]|uniref:GNAT family N-acetyltransferase n=1 Tax=Streptomyces yangpuensis TaxID=1648182 RepID=UPI003817EB07